MSLDPARSFQQAMHLFSTRQASAAARLLRKVLAANPGFVEAHQLLGAACSELGRHEEAIAHLESAVALRPRSAQAYYNLARAEMLAGKPAEALRHFEAGLALGPRAPQLLVGLGTALAALDRHTEAVECYRRALAHDGRSVEAIDNLGRSLLALGESARAVEPLERAAALDPNHAETAFSLGEALRLSGETGRAAAAFRKALRLAPHHDGALSGALQCALKSCDWSELEWLRKSMTAAVRADRPGINPAVLLQISDDPQLHLKCARSYARANARPYLSAPALGSRTLAGGKIRIAYFSADFREHASTHLSVGLFEQHDRERFEVIGVSIGGADDGSAIGARVRRAFDRFIDMPRASVPAIRAAVAELGLNIAVDLMGYTQHARRGLFSPRLAPLQVNFLGYPGTTGSGDMDAIVLDRFIASPALVSALAEKAIVLPTCYQVNDSRREPPAAPRQRADYGLPEDGFVFCCFNNTSKIIPEVFASWMRILGRVDGSVLWLLVPDAAAREHLRREAMRHGISAGRLVFGAILPLPEHLARYRVADLALDTFPYTSHTTASDALWCGCPVLTRVGASFASRVAGSLLTALNMPELILEQPDDYERMAVALASDRDFMHATRAKLDQQRGSARLFDTRAFVDEFEAALLDAWRRLPSEPATSASPMEAR